MITHRIEGRREFTTYIAEVNIMKSEFDRINKLLQIEDLEVVPTEELEKLRGKKDDAECIFGVQFDDGSTLDWHLCSGHINYYDNVVFQHPDGIYEDLDCSYVLDDIEIYSGENKYIVKLIIEDDTDVRLWDERFWESNEILWNILYKHRRHKTHIAWYGDEKNPSNMCLECFDCNQVILDAELYTIVARNDLE